MHDLKHRFVPDTNDIMNATVEEHIRNAVKSYTPKEQA